MAQAAALVVQAAQEVQVAQEEEAAQSHAAWAAVWLPTESPAQCSIPAVGYRVEVQRAAAVPAPWGSLAGALFSWAVGEAAAAGG